MQEKSCSHSTLQVIMSDSYMIPLHSCEKNPLSKTGGELTGGGLKR